MLSRRARWDSEELVKGENAGFAALPAYANLYKNSVRLLVERHISTFLTLVEDRRPWMVDTVFIWIGEDLSATLVNALGCHCGNWLCVSSEKPNYEKSTL